MFGFLKPRKTQVNTGNHRLYDLVYGYNAAH